MQDLEQSAWIMVFVVPFDNILRPLVKLVFEDGMYCDEAFIALFDNVYHLNK